MFKKTISFIAIFIIVFTILPLEEEVFGHYLSEKPRLGVWITVFSNEKVLFSKENADRLIDICNKTGINDVYLQIYRADKAYYDSDITDRSPFNARFSGFGGDPVKYLIKKGKENKIKIHAWMNLLSIAHNKEANIINKLGNDVITKDQHGRTALRKGNSDKLDKYYIRENQLFLEPGDPGVRTYLSDIAVEIVTKYPDLDGLHLDYVRYPVVVPFIPGSRFSSHGITYGYTRKNMKNFKDYSGIDMKKMKRSRKNYRLWDDWRRDQVTELVKEISHKVRKLSPEIEISCTIVPSIERTYLVTFQDWTRWLRENYIDYVVAMNYTEDTKLMEINSAAIMLPEYKDKVAIGIGAHLLTEKPDIFKEQFNLLEDLLPKGIVIFSYDDIAGNTDLQSFMAEKIKIRDLPPSSDGS